MILNLTMHAATPDQIAAGVKDLPKELRSRVIVLLTFVEMPDTDCQSSPP